jgi:hypothetical protein
LSLVVVVVVVVVVVCDAGYVCQCIEWARAGGRVSIPWKGRNCFRCVETAVENESEKRAICWQMSQCPQYVSSPHAARIDDRQMNAHVRFTWRRQRAAVTYAQPRAAVGLYASSPRFDLAQARSAALLYQSEFYLKLLLMWSYLFVYLILLYIHKQVL